MSQFAARDQASALAAPPHPEVDDFPGSHRVPPEPGRPGARLTAVNFRLLKQKLTRKGGHNRATGVDGSSAPCAVSGQSQLPSLAEPLIAEAVSLDPPAIADAAAAEPASSPAPPPEPASACVGDEFQPLGPPPFDLTSLKEESHPAVEVALSPVDPDIAALGLLTAAPEESAPAPGSEILVSPEPFTIDPEVAGSEIAEENAFEFPRHRQETGETGIQDLASLIGNASPRETEPVEEEPERITHQARDLRLILEPAVPLLDEFGTTNIGEAFAAPRPAAPPPQNVPPLDDTGAAHALRPDEYRFWENADEDPSPAASEPPPDIVDEAQAPAVPAEERVVPPEQEDEAPGRAGAAPETGPDQVPDLQQPEQPPAEPSRVSEVRRRFLHRPLEEPSEEAGEVARTLIEIMSLPSSAAQPQERALAADTLLHLIPRLPLRTLVAMAERLSVMEAPPALILAQLIHDRRIEIAGPLLEKCPAIADHDLIEVMADHNEQSNRMIARRRNLSPILCDALIATEDPSAILTLVRNPGAMLSHEAFHRLNEIARKHPSLQAPLATRADLPAPVAFELFWVLPAELRRYVISRFLTDSSTLGKILKLTMRIDSDAESPVAARFSTPEEIDRLIGAMTSGSMTEAERTLADALGLNLQTASRIIADGHGEPLCVALKALGVTRARFEEFVAAAKAGEMHKAGGLSELQGFFESLSFNKARVLLTYWDWGVLRTGPYAAVSA